MKKYFILFVIILNGFMLKGQNNLDSIKVSLFGPIDTVVFGSEITFRIIYSNVSNEPIVILKPDSSFYCGVRISPCFRKNSPSTGFGFGKSLLVQNFDSLGNVTEEYSVAAPSGKLILSNDKTYEFSFNMIGRIKNNLALLEPATYNIRFHDSKINKSEEKHFTMTFTKESIYYLVNFLNDSTSKSVFGLVNLYLKKIKPDIKLTYVKPDDKDYKEKNRENINEIKKLREYLSCKENEEIIKNNIELINHPPR